MKTLRGLGLYRRAPGGKVLPDSPVALIRADPYGDTESKDRPHKSVYTVLRSAGFDVRPAAYGRNGTGPGPVPKEAGIEMVNSLFCNAAGERRLFVACDDSRQPAAPKLVDAIEMSERDEAFKAERYRKGTQADLSHYPATVRYALWAVERPQLAGSIYGAVNG
jgi:hypothetical protein